MTCVMSVFPPAFVRGSSGAVSDFLFAGVDGVTAIGIAFDAWAADRLDELAAAGIVGAGAVAAAAATGAGVGRSAAGGAVAGPS